MKSQTSTFSSVCILPPSLLRWLTSIYRDTPKTPPNHTEKRIKERVLQKRRQKEEGKREVIEREKEIDRERMSEEERERDRQRQIEGERDRERRREREREGKRERERGREWEREREKE